MYGAKAYAKVGLETQCNSASPHGLIVMLYDGAILALKRAREHMINQAFADKGREINKALKIIHSGLMESLNYEQGGEVAINLMRMYEYISKTVVLSSARSNLALLDECIDLMTDLKASWNQIPLTITQAAHA